MVIGVAVGLFTTVSLLLGVWLAAAFFAPLLLVVLVVSVAAARSAARRLELRSLRWSQIYLIAIICWPISAALPYAVLKGEVKLRIDLPALPANATDVRIRAMPLSGGSIHGPAPGVVAEYWTPLPQDVAKSDLAASLALPVSFQEGHLHAIPNPDLAQAVANAERSGTRIKLGVFGNYTSALPWLMFFAGWGWTGIVFLTRPPSNES
jgi:hypothetical protein